MNDTKMDIQRAGETVERAGAKAAAKGTKGLSKLITKVVLYFRKQFGDPKKVIEIDGPNKAVCKTPILGEADTKAIVARLKKAEVLAYVQEVRTDGLDVRKNLHERDKEAKNDYKLLVWKDRAIKYARVPVLGKYCEDQMNAYQEAVKAERLENAPKERQFIIVTNVKNQQTLNNILNEVSQERVKEASFRENEYAIDDMNIDGKEAMEKDVTPLGAMTAEPVELKVEDIKKGAEYGTVASDRFTSQYSIKEVIPKDKFVEKYSDLNFEGTWAAKEYDANSMILYYHPDKKEQMRELFGDEKGRDIREYGANGGETIKDLRGTDALMTMRFNNPQELQKFRDLYDGHDYLIRYEQSGEYTVLTSRQATTDVAKNVTAKNHEAHERLRESLEKEAYVEKDKVMDSSWAEQKQEENEMELLADSFADEEKSV